MSWLSWVGPADYYNSDKSATRSGTVTIFLEQKLSVRFPYIASIEVVTCSVPVQRTAFREWEIVDSIDRLYKVGHTEWVKRDYAEWATWNKSRCAIWLVSLIVEQMIMDLRILQYIKVKKKKTPIPSRTILNTSKS